MPLKAKFGICMQARSGVYIMMYTVALASPLRLLELHLQVAIILYEGNKFKPLNAKQIVICAICLSQESNDNQSQHKMACSQISGISIQCNMLTIMVWQGPYSMTIVSI